MDGFDAEVFTRKIGGVPVFVWVGVGTIALIIVFRIRANRDAAVTAPAPQPQGEGDGENTEGDYTPGSDDGVIGNVGGGGSQPSPGGRAQNNTEWQVQAQDVLIGMGHDPLEVQRALGDYLSGLTLDYAQQRLVRIAVNTIGSPPEPVPIANKPVTPPIKTPPKPPTNPIRVTDPIGKVPPPPTRTVVRPKPTAPKVYVVQRGDTLSSIAAKFRMSWEKLYRANVNVIGPNPNLIKPGQRLVIP